MKSKERKNEIKRERERKSEIKRERERERKSESDGLELVMKLSIEPKKFEETAARTSGISPSLLESGNP